MEAITDANFDKVLHSKEPVLVDFWAEWCQPCKKLKLDGLKIKTYKLDVDKNPRIPAKYGVMGLPTLMIFKNGQVVWRHTGFDPGLMDEVRQVCTALNQSVRGHSG